MSWRKLLNDVVDEIEEGAVETGDWAYSVAENGYTDTDIQHLAWFIAGFCTTVSITVSLLLICDHVTHLKKPELQVHVIRIVWMVPVYALDACAGLVSSRYAWFWGSVRDIYEAFTIYSFFHLLCAMLDGEANTIHILRNKELDKEPTVPLPAFCRLGNIQMGEVFYYRVKFGVLQYVVVKPICCFVEVITHAFGVYGGNGRFSPTEAYMYISIVTNTSQMIALMALIYFYQHMNEELQRWHPLPKFLCIKMVVFFTYWQGLALTTLQEYGVIRGTQYFTSGQVNHGLQNLCLCVEMVVFAFCHHLVFDVKQFHETDEPVRTLFCPSLLQAFYVEKLKADVKTLETQMRKADLLGACGSRDIVLGRSFGSSGSPYGTAATIAPEGYAEQSMDSSAMLEPEMEELLECGYSDGSPAAIQLPDEEEDDNGYDPIYDPIEAGFEEYYQRQLNSDSLMGSSHRNTDQRSVPLATATGLETYEKLRQAHEYEL